MATSATNTYATADAVKQALSDYKTQDANAAAELDQIIETGKAFDGTDMHNPDDKPIENPAEPTPPEYYDSPGNEPAEDPAAENEDIEDAKSVINDNTVDEDNEDEESE